MKGVESCEKQALYPEIPEWGNPPRGMPGYPWLNKLGQEEGTGGTETSNYPEERKSFPE
jgi:hypothetical protein